MAKAGKSIQWKKDSVFNKWCWENWTATCRRVKPDHFLTASTKINSRWMRDPNVRQETIETLEEKAGNNLFDPGHSNFFLLDMSPEAREAKAKMNSWDLIKIKSFCTAKETISKTKRQLMEWEIFANDKTDKGLVSKIYKELLKLNTQKTNSSFKKCAEEGCLGGSVS